MARSIRVLVNRFGFPLCPLGRKIGDRKPERTANDMRCVGRGMVKGHHVHLFSFGGFGEPTLAASVRAIASMRATGPGGPKFPVCIFEFPSPADRH